MSKFFLIIIILSLNPYSHGFCEEIKLRFKEININFQPEKKSNIESVKKIQSFLDDYLISKGGTGDFLLTVTVKMYDILVRKEKSNKEIIKIFKKDSRVYVHNLKLTIILSNYDNIILESIDINISSQNQVDESLDFRQRKSLNNILYLDLQQKLATELKKNLLINLGDFVIPH